MSLITFLVAMLMANAVNASAIHVRQEAASPCEEQVPSQEFLDISRKLRLEASNSSLTRRQQGDFNFRVYAHVVFAYERADGGFVEKPLIEQQIQIMNEHYRNAGISFTLDSVSYTRNFHWAHGFDELGMKHNLRQGGYADLNMYFVAPIPSGSADGSRTLGVCYLPIPRQLEDLEFINDGCTLTAQSVPGVEGWIHKDFVATHEVGHYLGLYHTFEKGVWGQRMCFPGDDVEDTYPQEGPSYNSLDQMVWACGGWQQSNTFNFMDYSEHSNSFTPQQESHMRYFANVRRQIAAGRP
ncbi:metalloprotease 1 [Metarhizium guizhouense ARSEF 977]|uniref:Metalloprotease 1 n=1 Tax=Metarhizium guizhouense (strain ARSEF 977) TaxID=1276136 RepID=A0A0B4GMU7_METGA|nr:metalloprotease 1 [Metarhizium guizhouense ARSEF 977]